MRQSYSSTSKQATGVLAVREENTHTFDVLQQHVHIVVCAFDTHCNSSTYYNIWRAQLKLFRRLMCDATLRHH